MRVEEACDLSGLRAIGGRRNLREHGVGARLAEPVLRVHAAVAERAEPAPREQARAAMRVEVTDVRGAAHVPRGVQATGGLIHEVQAVAQVGPPRAADHARLQETRGEGTARGHAPDRALHGQ